MTTKKQVISVAGKEFKAVNDVFPIDNDSILHKESLEKQIARDSIINSDVSPQDIALVSGMPEEHTTTRRVRLFKVAKNAMQSGNKNTNLWKLGLFKDYFS